jgi:transposase-like protein
VGRQKQKKPLVFLTDDQKLEMLREYDHSGMNAQETCKKWGISTRSLFNAKQQLWGIYESTKETMNSREKIASLNVVRVDNSRKMAVVERKAGDVLDKVLSIMQHKLDIEESRLKGNDEGETPIPVGELTKFFQVAAPYFFQPLQPDESKGKTLLNTHKYITNILNQQVNIDGNNKAKD